MTGLFAVPDRPEARDGRTRRAKARRRCWGSPLLALLLAFLAAGLTVAVAAAHGTDLLGSEPLPGAVLDEAPTHVRAWFGGELNTARSNLQVFNADRVRVDNRDSTVDQNSTDQASMVVSLPPLSPGTYSVQWTAVATDGDSGIGKFRFTVAEPGLAPTEPPTPQPTPTPTDTPAPEPTASLTWTPSPVPALDKDEAGVPIVLIGAALGVALLAALAFVWRSR